MWRNVPDKLKERKQTVIKQLLTSRASSTVKRYILEIRKFCCWCQGFGVEVQLPFYCVTIAIYLSQCFQQSNNNNNNNNNINKTYIAPISIFLFSSALKM